MTASTYAHPEQTVYEFDPELLRFSGTGWDICIFLAGLPEVQRQQLRDALRPAAPEPEAPANGEVEPDEVDPL